ncbi:Ger(x)C family spore germination protein [Oceanobacillus halophilus]|nr:Ger(x)C family spore germination C-terminal domain-containing protein [Oceanobacillus halophilus]
MQSKFIRLLLVPLILLSGCVPNQVIEELAVISARGIDFTDDGKLEKTMNIIRFDPQSDEIYTTISGVSDTLKGARKNASFTTAYELVEGQMNLEIFGKEVAQKGIASYINTSVRDALASETMKVMVSATTAKAIFNSDSPESQSLGNYFDVLIDKQVSEGSLVPSSIHDFTRSTETIGQDGVMPLAGLENNTPTIMGLALFDKYQYVSDISLEQGLLLNLILNNLRETPMEIHLPRSPFEKYIIKDNTLNKDDDEKDELSIQVIVIDGKSKTDVTDMKETSFKTNVKMEIELIETSELLRIKDKKAASILEKEVEKKIKKQYENLLKQVQEVNVDPFGYGKLYRANKKDGKMKEEEWRKKFPEIKVNFNVNVRLSNYGSVQ